VTEKLSETFKQIDSEQLASLTNIKNLQRVESEKGDSKANIYFNEVLIYPRGVA